MSPAPISNTRNEATFARVDHPGGGLLPIRLYVDTNGDPWLTYLPVGVSVVNELRLLNTSEAASSQEVEDLAEDFRSAEMTWIAENLSQVAGQYPGEWLGIDGSSLIAHSPSLEEVFRIAAEAGHPDPLVTAVPSRPGEAFIG